MNHKKRARNERRKTQHWREVFGTPIMRTPYGTMWESADGNRVFFDALYPDLRNPRRRSRHWSDARREARTRNALHAQGRQATEAFGALLTRMLHDPY